MQFDLNDSLGNKARLGVRLRLLEGVRESVHKITTQDPSNTSWQRDVWISCWKIPAAMERLGDSHAVDWWRRAYEKLSALKQSGRFVSPQDEQVLQQLRCKLNL